MKVYCVSYDLNTPGQNYDDLIDELKESPDWWHYLQSTWLIQSSETPNQIWDRLGQHIDKNDYMLIIEVRDNTQGWLPQEAWDWIHSRVPNP